MFKTLPGVILTLLVLCTTYVQSSAQGFRWPRDNAFEIGGGISATGYHGQLGYVHFFQPKRPNEIPFSKKFKSLIGNTHYDAFPCKRQAELKIPPGVSAKLSAFYEQGSGRGVGYRIVGIDAALMYRVFSTETFFVSLKGGITVSNNKLLDQLPEGSKLSYYERYKYGLLGGVEIDKMIDKYRTKSIVAGWEECYLINGGIWGSKRWYAFVGLRLNIPTY